MKKHIFFLLLLSFLGCKSLGTINLDENFTYHDISYLNNKVFDEYTYDSRTNIYTSIERNSPNDGFKETKIKIELKKEQLKKIYYLYLKLKIPNPNKCIHDKENNELLAKSLIRFYNNKKNWKDEQCNIDINNKDFSNLWGEINDAILSTPEYKEAFKFIGK